MNREFEDRSFSYYNEIISILQGENWNKRNDSYRLGLVLKVFAYEEELKGRKEIEAYACYILEEIKKERNVFYKKENKKNN